MKDEHPTQPHNHIPTDAPVSPVHPDSHAARLLTEPLSEDEEQSAPEQLEFPPSFEEKLKSLLNSHNWDGTTNTPDFVLTQFTLDMLAALDRMLIARDQCHLPKGERNAVFPPPSDFHTEASMQDIMRGAANRANQSPSIQELRVAIGVANKALRIAEAATRALNKLHARVTELERRKIAAGPVTLDGVEVGELSLHTGEPPDVVGTITLVRDVKEVDSVR